MEALTIVQLTTVAGIAGFTTLVSELIWRTVATTAAVRDRFGPLVAVVIGVGAGIGAALLLGQVQLDLAQSALNGIVGGLTAMGVHDLVSSKAGVA